MSRWFRFYDEVINDPKILRLSDANFRTWVTLLCVASKHDGKLPPTNDIALVLRVKPTKVAEWLTVLTSAGLLDCGANGVFSPHNWASRQYKSDVTDPTNAQRQQRYRDRHRNGQSTVTIKRPDTEAETDTEPEQKRGTRASALVDPWSEDDWIQFWQRFPNKIGKADARKAFERATKKVSPEILFPALGNYAAKTDDRPFCNPSTWLNQERWLDQPAKTNGRRTVQQAADALLAKIRAFDEPAPDGLCDGESEDVVRLLPPN